MIEIDRYLCTQTRWPRRCYCFSFSVRRSSADLATRSRGAHRDDFGTPNLMERVVMTTGETELEMAVRHVAEQETRITRQKMLIERLRKAGAPTANAYDLLDTMLELLESMRAHVAGLGS